MHFCFVGHGLKPIPPCGRGAIESMIWDKKFWYERYGHRVTIINTPDESEIVETVNRVMPDVVELYCERHFHLAGMLRAEIRILASQWPYLFHTAPADKIRKVFDAPGYVSCASRRVFDRCLDAGITCDRLFIARHGARGDLIRFTSTPALSERSVCIAVVAKRKRQYLLTDRNDIDFYGPIATDSAGFTHPNYRGEIAKAEIYSDLTNYGSMVLFSEAEVGTALVICDALAAGLSLVLSEAAAEGVDVSCPFVQVVPEKLIDDRDFVGALLKRSRAVALGARSEIRRYALSVVDWAVVAQEHIAAVETIRMRQAGGVRCD